ncbi:MAG: DUF3772 domain-containing protein [Paracoccaceae bacterium]
MRQTLDAQLAEIAPIQEQVQTRLDPLRQQLEALGEPPADGTEELPQIAEERRRIASDLAEIEAQARRADQAEARAEGLVTRLATLRQSLFTAQLLARGPTILLPHVFFEGIAAIERTVRTVVAETRLRWQNLAGDIAGQLRILVPLLGVVVGALALLRARKMALDWLLSGLSEETPHSRRVSIGAGVTLARLLMPAGALALFFSGIYFIGIAGPRGEAVIIGLGTAAAAVIGAYALGGAYFAPTSRTLRLAALDDADALAAHRWIMLLAAVVGFDRAFIHVGQQLGLAIEGLTLLNAALMTVGGVSLFFVTRYVRPPEPAARLEKPGDEDDAEAPRPLRVDRPIVSLLRFLSRVSAVAAPILALAGYYAASRYAFFPVVFSGALIGICLLLYHIVRTILGEASSRNGEEEGAVARLKLVELGLGFLIFCAALPAIALIWGADPQDLGVGWRRVVAGFTIGDVTIAPIDFFIFVIVLVVGIILVRRFQALLRRTVLPFTGLDTGGRDAVASGAGHLGIVVVALIAISSTGLDLSNLAIVAGALSVGIGFGLQNIVNNFVSGVILLVERPIKAGDWIELPSGMGYVKSINIRSTMVETFDRAALFVPNSELISSPVINWTHSNLNGRIIVSVGVDYESDPRKVERILLEIGKAHPMLLRRPPPYVLFRGFGADSLNFEIRGILRDVNWLLNVQSDLYFEIARRFDQEGIGIPFRQADIKLKNAEQIAHAFGTALRPAHGPFEEASRSRVPRELAVPRERTAAGYEGADGDGDH